jgi:hypothetical protein
MQISGVSLTLTWPLRLCLLRVLLCGSHCYKLFPFQAHRGKWHCTRFLRPACIFTVHVGSGPSPLSCGVFLPPPLLQAFPLLVAGQVPPLLLSPANLWGISPPLLFGAQGTPPSLLCVFFVVIAYYSGFFFFFSLGGGQSVQGGYADLAQGCLWEYRVPLSSPCGPCLPKPSGCCCLAAAWKPSWFLHLLCEVRCFAQAGGVEESKFCLFLVVFPVRCVSSVSPRFYFRRHTFSFHPLATIL